ncbi:MAG: hypothetical protein IPM47_14885 [Sphingobacteriales bacterium]|nr:MAG: hypothetical protein IPM47_14885 [Sphingobacteriales bacterium]
MICKINKAGTRKDTNAFIIEMFVIYFNEVANAQEETTFIVFVNDLVVANQNC